MTDFHLQVYTPERKVFEDRVQSMILPAIGGYVGVLARHAPMVAALDRGTLTIIRERAGKAESVSYEVQGGFLEVHRNQATLLLDQFENHQAPSETLAGT